MFAKKAYAYSTFLLLIFLLLPYSVLASNSTGNNSQDKPSVQKNDKDKGSMYIKEDKFIEWMEKVNKGLHQSKSYNPVNPNNLVLFIGPTGAGKSTTICSLLLGKLEKRKKFSNRNGKKRSIGTEIDISAKDAKNAKEGTYPKIGHSLKKSCTLYPACYQLKKHNLWLCDFAGLFDTGGIEKRAVISIISKQFLEQPKNVKAVVFLMAQSDLKSSKGQLLNKAIQSLQKMFANPLDHVDSIFFALTKANDDCTIDTFIGTISELAAENMDTSELEEKVDTSELAEKVDTSELAGKVETKKAPDSSPSSNLVDTMLDDHENNFLLVNPLEEESSKLIIDRIKQSKGFPSNKIRFIGDEDIVSASFCFFTKCAKEGIKILDICNNYPRKIKEKNKDISDLDTEIAKLSGEINEAKNKKENKKILESLFKQNESDIAKLNNQLTKLREEKKDAADYIKNNDNSNLIEVARRTLYKKDMTPHNPLFSYRYRRGNLYVNAASYCDWDIKFNTKMGAIEKWGYSDMQFWVKYWCYENGGGDLTVTLKEKNNVYNKEKIKNTKARDKELTEIAIPDHRVAIAKIAGKLEMIKIFSSKYITPPNLGKALESLQERKKKDLILLQNQLREMKKELKDAEKKLCKKLKLFDIIKKTHKLLGFTCGDIPEFVEEYKKSSSRVREIVRKAENNHGGSYKSGANEVFDID